MWGWPYTPHLRVFNNITAMLVTTINVFSSSNSVGDFLWNICFLFCEDWIINFSLRKESHQSFSNCMERDHLEEPISYTAYTLSFLWHLVQFQKVFRLLLNSVPSCILICKDLQLFQWENLWGKIPAKMDWSISPMSELIHEWSYSHAQQTPEFSLAL